MFCFFCQTYLACIWKLYDVRSKIPRLAFLMTVLNGTERERERERKRERERERERERAMGGGTGEREREEGEEWRDGER